jgi:peptide/nickel transport system permease protein
MATYILKRILLFIPTFLLITLVTFTISRLAPGDPADLAVGGLTERADRGATKEMREKIRAQWHLNEEIHVQYYYWISGLAKFDFGTSLKDDRPVLDKILERIPVTMLMSVMSIILAYLIAIPIGIKSATNPGGAFDRLTSSVLFMLYSLPSFWIATLAIIYICRGSGFVDLFPPFGIHSVGYESTWGFWAAAGDLIWHLMLPTLIYTYASFAFISRQMRGAMLEVVRQDYIRTARAKGLAERAVIYRHALRNSLIPIITLFAGLFPALIGGSVIIEQIFSIPGMGQLAIQALNERDYTIIMGELTFTAVLTMVGVLVADILYSVVDPRIAFSRKSS